ncbi:MAG: hypothetical protein ACFFCQ_17305 [Promethearchaeota archaeon]
MKKITNFLLVGLLGILMIGASFITPTSALPSQHPPGAINPQAPMKAKILQELLRYLPRLQNANFTGTNVLYTTFSATGTFEKEINVDKEISANVGLSTIKLSVTTIKQRFENMNNSITARLAGEGSDNLNISYVWHTMNRTLVEDDYYICVLSYLAFYYSPTFQTAGIEDFEGWLKASHFEWRLLRLLWRLSYEFRLDLPTFCRAFEVMNPIGLANRAITILTECETELLTHNTLTMARRDIVDLDVTLTIDDRAVVILWDHDGTVLDVLDNIKNNETAGGQPFSGDEVIHATYMTDEQKTTSGSIEITNTWKYEDDSSADVLYKLLRILFKERVAGLSVGDIPLHRFSFFLGPRNEAHSGSFLERDTRFGVAQLRINELILDRNPRGHLFLASSDFDFIEHHSLGNIIYNDTNGDGRLTLKMEMSPEGVPYQTNESESLYRFRIVNFGDKTYQAPQTDNNELTFGFNFANAEGRLFPTDIDEEVSGFNQTYAPISEKIDELEGLFHFSVDPETGESHLKFDYILGNWNNTEPLAGLSFAHLMGSTFIKRTTEQTIDEVISETNEEVDDTSVETQRISRFRFRYGGKQIADVYLDDIPYEWNSTQQNAIGLLIPLRFAEMSYGRSSSNGEIIRNMQGQVQRRTYLYTISYPKWSGLAISHDPDFVVSAGEATLEPSSSKEDGGIPGFEIGFGLIGLIGLIGLRKRRK